jgi:hypothetical protein
MCRWLDPFIFVRIEFLEWTADNRLRHPRFAGIRSEKIRLKLRVNRRFRQLSQRSTESSG